VRSSTYSRRNNRPPKANRTTTMEAARPTKAGIRRIPAFVA